MTRADASGDVVRRPAAAARALLAVVALLAGGGAQAGSVEVPLQIGGAFRVPVTSLQEARFRATVRQQFDFSCGSAALSTLLSHHYGHKVSESAVFDAMYAAGDRDAIRRDGFSLLDMKRYLAGLGFDADGFQAPLDSLAQAGVPAVVLINERGYNHFVVVKGLRDDRVLIGDPATGTRAMARSNFEALRANDILFVVANRSDAVRFDSSAEWQALPRAPLAAGVAAPIGLAALPKLGGSDF